MVPTCSVCRADSIGFAVPAAIRELAPEGTEAAAVCRVCLTVDHLDEPPDSQVELGVISEALPSDPEHAAAICLIVGLLESLALNRRNIEAIVDYLEAEGVDALLVLNRLADEPGLRPAIDLERRVYQLEQLLG